MQKVKFKVHTPSEVFLKPTPSCGMDANSSVTDFMPVCGVYLLVQLPHTTGSGICSYPMSHPISNTQLTIIIFFISITKTLKLYLNTVKFAAYIFAMFVNILVMVCFIIDICNYSVIF